MLEFELDTLDGVDEGIKGLYSEHEGKFRLQVKGLDPADELKKALSNERNQSKEAKTRLAELERLQKELEEKQLTEKQQFETLWKSEKEAKSKTLAELETLRKSISDKERSETALTIAAQLTRDTKRAELLKKEALGYIQHTPDGVKILIDGVDADAKTLSERLAKDFPFLADGNQSSGGGSRGNEGKGGTTPEITRDDFVALTPDAQMKFVKDGGKII